MRFFPQVLVRNNLYLQTSWLRKLACWKVILAVDLRPSLNLLKSCPMNNK
uniref:Uncharacterized protein n=1 Tax=Rhizophora mucronata TaxID=61149 RepID=A0A2P2QFU6_RHIMU